LSALDINTGDSLRTAITTHFSFNKGLTTRGNVSPFLFQNNHMIDAILFTRLLNPIAHQNFSKKFVFLQKIGIISDLV
jgi:hypothetical protein